MRRKMMVTLATLFTLTFAGVADSRTPERASSGAVSGNSERPAAVQAQAKTAAPLFLIVRGTPDGKATAVPFALYRGRVSPGATLTVNGEAVEISKLGFWGVKVPLAAGENTFTFTATSAAGETMTVVRHVTFDASLASAHLRTPGSQGKADHVRQFEAATKRS